MAARDATLGLGPSKSALDYNREGREQGLPDDAWPEQEVRTPTAGAAAAAGGGAQRPLVMYQVRAFGVCMAITNCASKPMSCTVVYYKHRQPFIS